MLNEKKLFSRAVGAILLTALAYPVYSEPEHLEQMVVTATRTETSHAISAFSVITREEIENHDYRTLAEALAGLPGVTIGNYGGPGKQTSLFIRGTESNHTQILLNGVKLASNEFGTPQLEHIPIQAIERIELVRGPQSSLYGAASIGGTIQIFTRQKQTGVQPRFSLAAGSHNSKEMTIGFSAGNEFGWLNFDAGTLASDGFNSCDGRSASLFIGCYVNEPDKDAYRNNNYSLRTGTELGARIKLEAFKLYSSGTTHYDGYYNETLFQQYTSGFVAKADLTKNWKLTSSVSKSIFNSRNFGTASSRFDNKKNTFSIQSDLSILNQHIFTLGYDYEDDKVDALTAYDNAKRHNKAYFTQFQGRSGKQDYRFSLRADENEQYGHNTSVNAAWGYHFSNDTHAFISYGEAFAAPSFVDLYAPWSGNINLKPEESKSIEIGISGNLAEINWTLSIFESKIHNLISFENSSMQNIANAEIKGIELTASTILWGVNLDGQLSLLDPENRAKAAYHGNILPRRAQQTFTLNAFKDWGKYRLASKFYASGRRFDDNANERRLSGFATLDVTGSYQFTSSTSLRLKIANLLDKQYETVAGYNNDRVNFMLSFHYLPR